jgi:hypothetical protein
VVYSLARYDSLLDAEKLRSSLERLASIKGWKKLGARLRKNVCCIRSQHRQAPFSYRLWMLTASDRARVKSSITFPRPLQQSDLPLPSHTQSTMWPLMRTRWHRSCRDRILPDR